MSLCCRITAVVALACAALQGAATDRINGAIDREERVVLHGGARAVPNAAIDRGALAADRQIAGIRLILNPSPEQAAALDQLLESQRNPSSADFHRWLTPEDFGERFGLSESDLAQIASWLSAEGLHVDEIARARNRIVFSGTAGVLSRVFETDLRGYDLNGNTHFAAVREPSIPAALSSVISSLRGLDDFHPRPLHVVTPTPAYTATSGAHYLAPGDFATIYDVGALYTAGYTGALEKLAIVGQTDISLTDTRAFRAQFGLPAIDPQIVLTGPDPGTSPNDQVEAELDVEWSGAIARNATVIYVNSQDVFTSLEYAIDQNIAPVVSMSYGMCELEASTGFRTLAQQANAEGITWVNASGDSGAAGCDYGAATAQHGPSVIFPADIPEVTAVGGTEFNELGSIGWSPANNTSLTSVTEYLAEKAWNDTPLGQDLAASGGGASALFAKPWWQTGTGVPSDGARDVPDIAFTASGDHDPYIIYYSGHLMEVGGTSCAAPSFAGILTLINQYVVAKGAQAKPGLGNINPNLYALAQSASAASAFHDITIGNNTVPCISGSTGCKAGSFGYSAGKGYDQVTGLGSLDAYNLATKWAAVPQAVGTTTTMVASPATLATSASTQLIASIAAVSGTVAPAGSVSFSVGGATLGSAAVVASVSGAKSTATLSVKGSVLANGSNAISAAYSPSGNFAGSGGTVSVFVTAPVVATTTSLTANPATISSNATTQITATVKPASGTTAPGGNITVTLGSTVVGSAALTASGSNASAVITVKGTSLATGGNTLAVSYAPSGNFAASNAAIAVTVTSPLTATTTSIAAPQTSIAATASTTLSVTVRPASGIVVPTGAVTFTAGSSALGAATLSSGTASFTVKGSSLTTGANTITVSYAGSTAFSGSSGTIALTVTGASSPSATVILTAAKAASKIIGFPVTLQLNETAGVAATVTGFTINGTDFSSVIAAAFGSAKLPAHGSLSATLIVQWSPLPATLAFDLSGTDANGHIWSQTTSLGTAPAQTNTK